jgi:GTPase SAR1 family protein
MGACHSNCECELPSPIADKRLPAVKTLILGSSGCGKTTFMKQLRLLHGVAFTEEDRTRYREMIYASILNCIKILIKEAKRLEIKYAVRENIQFAENVLATSELVPAPGNSVQKYDSKENEEEEVSAADAPAAIFSRLAAPAASSAAVSSSPSPSGEAADCSSEHVAPSFCRWPSPSLALAIISLWTTEEAIRKVYARRAEFTLPDAAEYLLNSAARILAAGYGPTDEDILRIKDPVPDTSHARRKAAEFVAVEKGSSAPPTPNRSPKPSPQVSPSLGAVASPTASTRSSPISPILASSKESWPDTASWNLAAGIPQIATQAQGANLNATGNHLLAVPPAAGGAASVPISKTLPHSSSSSSSRRGSGLRWRFTEISSFDSSSKRKLTASFRPTSSDSPPGALLFMVDLTDFDQYDYLPCGMLVDPSKNKMKEAVAVWETVLNLPWLKKVPVVLLLNKYDLFVKKVNRGHFGAHFSDFYGSEEDHESVLSYIENLFIAANRDSRRVVVSHTVDATDTAQVGAVWQAIRQVTLQYKKQSSSKNTGNRKYRKEKNAEAAATIR